MSSPLPPTVKYPSPKTPLLPSSSAELTVPIEGTAPLSVSTADLPTLLQYDANWGISISFRCILHNFATLKICVVIHFSVLPWGFLWQPCFPQILRVSVAVLGHEARDTEQLTLQAGRAAEPLFTPTLLKTSKFLKGFLRKWVKKKTFKVGIYCFRSSQDPTFLVIVGRRGITCFGPGGMPQHAGDQWAPETSLSTIRSVDFYGTYLSLMCLPKPAEVPAPNCSSGPASLMSTT